MSNKVEVDILSLKNFDLDNWTGPSYSNCFNDSTL